MSQERSSTPQELTRWFPIQVNPVHVGVYEIDQGQPRRMKKYSHWNGIYWGFREGTPDQAFFYRDSSAYGPILRWRGLARRP